MDISKRTRYELDFTKFNSGELDKFYSALKILQNIPQFLTVDKQILEDKKLLEEEQL